jgi:putative effector of murein hydrolase
MTWLESLPQTVFWSVVTIGLYVFARDLHRRSPRLWLSPVLVTPALLTALALALHEASSDYSRATHWLALMLGPAMVAFAVPIFERRELIRRHWLSLTIGVFAGSGIAILTAWTLASLLGLSGAVRLSLLTRSISTPFALAVSSDIGGAPELTAIFVLITGLVGAAIGQTMLRFVPTSRLARGALFGMGAHGVGVATAAQIGKEEGSIAGLVMVLAGIANVMAAAIFEVIRHHAAA